MQRYINHYICNVQGQPGPPVGEIITSPDSTVETGLVSDTIQKEKKISAAGHLGEIGHIDEFGHLDLFPLPSE